jgi:hypothetical protein
MATAKSQKPLWLQFFATPCLVFTILSLVLVTIAHAYFWWLTLGPLRHPPREEGAGLGIALIWFYFTFYMAPISTILCLASIATAIVAGLRFRWARYLIVLTTAFFLWSLAFSIGLVAWIKLHG